MAREKCGVQGKTVYPTRDAAQAILTEFRKHHSGKGTVYRCIFGDHYHVTKGLMGRKGRRDFR
jgi:hypothetical protein